jgi:hypothetical protein
VGNSVDENNRERKRYFLVWDQGSRRFHNLALKDKEVEPRNWSAPEVDTNKELLSKKINSITFSDIKCVAFGVLHNTSVAFTRTKEFAENKASPSPPDPLSSLENKARDVIC